MPSADHLDHGPIAPIAWRLLLATLDWGNRPARQQLIDEIGGCAECWQQIAEYIAVTYLNDMARLQRSLAETDDMVVRRLEQSIREPTS